MADGTDVHDKRNWHCVAENNRLWYYNNLKDAIIIQNVYTYIYSLDKEVKRIIPGKNSEHHSQQFFHSN